MCKSNFVEGTLLVSPNFLQFYLDDRNWNLIEKELPKIARKDFKQQRESVKNNLFILF